LLDKKQKHPVKDEPHSIKSEPSDKAIKNEVCLHNIVAAIPANNVFKMSPGPRGPVTPPPSKPHKRNYSKVEQSPLAIRTPEQRRTVSDTIVQAAQVDPESSAYRKSVAESTRGSRKRLEMAEEDEE
jgi:hypothetical protein